MSLKYDPAATFSEIHVSVALQVLVAPRTAPYTLNPAPFILHPTPYTLHPTPYT